jgi:dimethylhistidine N-methyltransferase
MKTTTRFFEDVLTGLNAKPKYLQSKYFYDAEGDKIFQEIMDCPEYYPTNCEMEIFTKQTDKLIDIFNSHLDEYDVIELGAGDATKSVHLLKALKERGVDYTYYPIDISSNVIRQLKKNLPKQVPGINIYGLNGEYFEMLEEANHISKRKKVVLFMGANIGNVPMEDAAKFCKDLRSHLRPGDIALIGFDLKKDPETILAAYNDKGGITRRFNLNLLTRINEELGADFDVKNFKHYPVYNPVTGACKSYLVSLKEQTVCIGDTEVIRFAPYEAIFMEISQKYTVNQTNKLAKLSKFQPIAHLYDSKEWFLDAIWQCV